MTTETAQYKWDEPDDAAAPRVPRDVVDIVYRIHCRAVPMDHAYLLSQALCRALPWLVEEPSAGPHIIHGADSGNGWYRPEGGNELLYLTRRAKLELRIPAHRYEDSERLTGTVLDLGGNPLDVGEASLRPLSDLTTLYSRYVISSQAEGEGGFLERIGRELHGMGIAARRLVPGRSNWLYHPDGPLLTRSLMLDDLRFDDAVRLQERGLGLGRILGCGLFIPHKAIKVTANQDD